jgi:hypothetical protein
LVTFLTLFLKHNEVLLFIDAITNHIIFNFVSLCILRPFPTKLVQPYLVAIPIELAVVTFFVKNHSVTPLVI